MTVLDTALLPLESWADTPRTVLGELFDRLALRGVRFLMAQTIWPPAADFAAIRAAAEPYVSEGLQRHPRAFFSFLDAPVAHGVSVQRRHRIAGGQIVEREIRGPYEPFHRTATTRCWPENERIPLDHWIHRPRRARATVVALHGLGMGDRRLNAYGLMAQRWFDAGFDVVLPTLPLHGVRTPAEARYSGELFVSWDPARLNEAIRRAVFDLHVLQTWLAGRDDRPVGLFGLSLGGYLASLMAGLVSWPAFVVPMLAPVCFGAVALAMCGDVAGAAPFTLEEIRRAHRIHSPLTHPLAIPRERVLVIGGRGDRVVPPEHAHALWKHWNEPAIHWVSGGHTALFRRPRLMGHILAHVRRFGLNDDRPVAPPAPRAAVVPFDPPDGRATRRRRAVRRGAIQAGAGACP